MIGWILAGLAGAALLSGDSDSMVSSKDCKCQFCGRYAEKEYAGETEEKIRARFCCKCGRTWTKWYEKKY